MKRSDGRPDPRIPLEKLDTLDRQKVTAFLGLFAGARLDWRCFNGKRPTMGKSECEWVPDWRNFYAVELPSLGLITFEESEPRPALGMGPGSTVTDIQIGITEEGRAAREAWWARLHSQCDADES